VAPLLAPLEEGCRGCPQELVCLAGVSPLAGVLQGPHQLEGAAQLPAQHGPIQHGHEPQRPGHHPRAGRELLAVDPEGIGDGEGLRAVHVQARAGRLGPRQGARHHVRDVGQTGDPGQGGQLSDPGWAVVLDAVVLRGGGSAAHAHTDRGTASEGAAECVGVVQVALDILQIRVAVPSSRGRSDQQPDTVALTARLPGHRCPELPGAADHQHRLSHQESSSASSASASSTHCRRASAVRSPCRAVSRPARAAGVGAAASLSMIAMNSSCWACSALR
jgi:hypothetical protein